MSEPTEPKDPQVPEVPSTPAVPPPPAAPAPGGYTYEPPVAPPAPAAAPGAPAVPAWTPPPAPDAPAYGAPPAPPSAYPTPEAGGFPPPPPGGFGAPPAGGFPAAPSYEGGYASPPDVGQAVSWGWAKFKAQAGALILSHLLWGVALLAVVGIGFAILAAAAGSGAASSSDGTTAAFGALGVVGMIVLTFIAVLGAFLAQIGITNGYLAIADGRTAKIGDFFTFRNAGAGVLAALIISVASALLSITWVGGIAVSFFAMYVIYFVVDRNLDAIAAIKASVSVAMKNPAQTALLLLIVAVLGSVGAAICGIGALVTVPISGLATAWLYRRLSGGQVAA